MSFPWLIDRVEEQPRCPRDTIVVARCIENCVEKLANCRLAFRRAQVEDPAELGRLTYRPPGPLLIAVHRNARDAKTSVKGYGNGTAPQVTSLD